MLGVPDVVRRLSKKGVEVLVETGAGARAHVPDEEFEAAGATIGSAEQAWGADAVAFVKAPGAAEIERLERTQDELLDRLLAESP